MSAPELCFDELRKFGVKVLNKKKETVQCAFCGNIFTLKRDAGGRLQHGSWHCINKCNT